MRKSTVSENLTIGRPQSNIHGAAITAYQKYVAAYEVTINPTHSLLQSDFCKYLQEHRSDISQDIEHVDVRYKDKKGRTVLVEVKPCERETARYAIRTAMGKLLDYEQRHTSDVRLLIVTQTKPCKEVTRLC